MEPFKKEKVIEQVLLVGIGVCIVGMVLKVASNDNFYINRLLHRGASQEKEVEQVVKAESVPIGEVVTRHGEAPAKEKTFQLANMEEIIFDIQRADLEISFSDGEEMIVREFTKETDQSYLFNEAQGDHEIVISSETQNHFFGFLQGTHYKSHVIEVILPTDYKEDLSINTSSGKVNFFTDCQLNELNVEVGSGSISSKGLIKAEDVHIQTVSGKIELEGIEASEYLINATSGKINVKYLAGEGKIENVSGNIDVNVKALTGDVKIETVSGSVDFKFEQGVSAIVNTEKIYEEEAFKIGNEPVHEVDIQTVSGRITVEKE